MSANVSVSSLHGPGRPSRFSIRYIDPLSLPAAAAAGIKCSYSGAASSIPSKIWHESIYVLAIPIAFIFNLSIRTSTFLDALKYATVVPIYKGKGDPNEPGNYRPISLTSYLSKLFEKCILSQLEGYLVGERLLSEYQHGFLSGRSTEAALLDIYQFIYDGWASRRHVIALFLDLSKAFDCLQHDVLVSALSSMGVDSDSCRWFLSFLSRRLLSVTHDGDHSDPVVVDCGVPQGSVLGPFLFVVYMDAILCTANSLSDRLRMISCAEDSTVLFHVDRSLHSAEIPILNSMLVEIVSMFSVHKLSLNTDKCELLWFR